MKSMIYFCRILSTEIFAFKGSVDKDLITILEKLFDEKSSIIQSWCDLMVTNSGSSVGHDTSILSTDEKSADIGKNIQTLITSGPWLLRFSIIGAFSICAQFQKSAFIFGSCGFSLI